MINKPTINELGLDLLKVNLFQKTWVLCKPIIFIGLFIIAFKLKYYLLLPIIIFFLFVAVIHLTHDLVHQSLGFNPMINNILLTISGAIILESGHSYQITHLIHHKNFPHQIDPEGEPAKKTILKSLLIGPIYIPKLYLWAFKNANSTQKKWLKLELFIAISIISVSLYLTTNSYIFITYCLMVIFGGWFYPLITVYTPHHLYKGEELSNTICYRGSISAFIFANLTFHLEHHLYPFVPTCNLHKLAKKLDPFFLQNKDKIRFKKIM